MKRLILALCLIHPIRPGWAAETLPVTASSIRLEIGGYLNQGILLQETRGTVRTTYRIAFFLGDTLMDYQDLPEAMFRYVVERLSLAVREEGNTFRERASCSRAVDISWKAGVSHPRLGLCLDSLSGSPKSKLGEWIRGVSILRGF